MYSVVYYVDIAIYTWAKFRTLARAHGLHWVLLIGVINKCNVSTIHGPY